MRILLLITISAVSAQVSPGSRYAHVMEQTDSDSLYIFGGIGYGNTAANGLLNDVWRFDLPTSTFSHVNGPQTIDGSATFGSTPNPANQPGARGRAASTFLNSKIYVFGGYGYVTSDSWGYLADMWSFDPFTVMWLYLGGSQLPNDVGVYGPPNSYSSTSFRPGGRHLPGMSRNRNGTELIIFGGQGRDSGTVASSLGDVWYFRLSDKTWAYIAGHTSGGQSGSFSNPLRPGTRYGMTFECATGTDMCYLFSGHGLNNAGWGILNDLWSFNQTSGVFLPLSRGDYNVANMGGAYGTKGTAAPGNTPGSRYNSASYFDSTNNRVIVYGGYGYASTGDIGILNDVWSFEVSSGNWAWLSGANVINEEALASTRGGARNWHAIASNSSTSFYIFGGFGYGFSTIGYLQDLWIHTIADTWNLLGGSLSGNVQGDYFDEAGMRTTSTSTTTSPATSTTTQPTSSTTSSSNSSPMTSSTSATLTTTISTAASTSTTVTNSATSTSTQTTSTSTKSTSTSTTTAPVTRISTTVAFSTDSSTSTSATLTSSTTTLTSTSTPVATLINATDVAFSSTTTFGSTSENMTTTTSEASVSSPSATVSTSSFAAIATTASTTSTESIGVSTSAFRSTSEAFTVSTSTSTTLSLTSTTAVRVTTTEDNGDITSSWTALTLLTTGAATNGNPSSIETRPNKTASASFVPTSEAVSRDQGQETQAGILSIWYVVVIVIATVAFCGIATCANLCLYGRSTSKRASVALSMSPIVQSNQATPFTTTSGAMSSLTPFYTTATRGYTSLTATYVDQNQKLLAFPAFLEHYSNQFRLIRQIAAGGGGKVSLAEGISQELGFGTTFVVKEISNVNERVRRSFEQEVSLMFMLKNERNVAKLIGFCSDPLMILMKFYPEGSLDGYIHRKRTRKVKSQTYALVLDVANGLCALHKLGVAHCDVKPQNVLLESENMRLTAVLTDFGVSRVVTDQTLAVKSFEVSNIRALTIFYAAPEVLMGFKQKSVIYDPAFSLPADVYAFAVSLFELVTFTGAWSKI